MPVPVKFAQTKPGELFETERKPGALFYKIPEPEGFLPHGCSGCGEQRIWNARCVESDRLEHFCPDEDVLPVEEVVEFVAAWPEGEEKRRGGF